MLHLCWAFAVALPVQRLEDLLLRCTADENQLPEGPETLGLVKQGRY